MEGLIMNENSQQNSTASGVAATAAIGFVLGAVVGAGIALLLAPASGEVTRRRVTDAGRRLGGEARGHVDRVLDAAGDLQKDAKSALQAGRESFENSRKSDEPSPVSGEGRVSR